MKTFTLVRVLKTYKGTFGVLIGPNENPICNTIERDWRENRVNVSCIPEGFYKAHLSVRHAGKENAYPVYMLENVIGRTLIQVHRANEPNELMGCIAPVTRWAEFSGNPGGASSGTAFQIFMTATGGADRIGFWIKDACIDASEFPGTITNVGE